MIMGLEIFGAMLVLTRADDVAKARIAKAQAPAESVAGASV
jgi:hypothetical protein